MIIQEIIAVIVVIVILVLSFGVARMELFE